MDTTELINHLGVRHRATPAYRRLFAMGFAVVPAAREGLRHENAAVRSYCCVLLDHFLVPEALSDLVGMLRDPDALVRQSALHTLACDRCKQGACRPVKLRCFPRHCGYCMKTPIPMCAPWRLKLSASTCTRTQLLSVRWLMPTATIRAPLSAKRLAGTYQVALFTRARPHVLPEKHVSERRLSFTACCNVLAYRPTRHSSRPLYAGKNSTISSACAIIHGGA